MEGDRNTLLPSARAERKPLDQKKNQPPRHQRALYLGEGRYIHSTGAAVSGGVVINSLESSDPLYREDLVKCLYAVGSIF